MTRRVGIALLHDGAAVDRRDRVVGGGYARGDAGQRRHARDGDEGTAAGHTAEIRRAAPAPLLRRPEPEIRARALRLLTRVGGAGDVETVQPLVSDPDDEVCVAAVELVCRHGGPEGGP